MIFRSLPMMTIIDVIIISLAISALYILTRYRQTLRQLQAFTAFILIVLGVSCVGVFYLVDLFTMFGLPMIIGATQAMDVMRDLHLNVNWMVQLIAIALIVTGTSALGRRLFPRIAGLFHDLERTNAQLASDIAERQRVEQVLRESEERFRTMADTAPVMIWVSGPDKRCIYFNKGWLDFTGRTIKQEWGNGWMEGVHPDDLERCCDTYSTAFDKRRDFTMEYRLRRYDAMYRWIVDAGAPRFFPDGDFAGYIGACIDVTEHKQLEEDLQQARHTLEQQVEERTAALLEANTSLLHEIAERQRMQEEREHLITELEAKNAELEQFTYTVSHDLKSPLLTMHGFLGYLERDVAAGHAERVQQDVEYVQVAVENMRQLLDDLLELSRIGRVVNPPQMFSFNELVHEVLAYSAGQITALGVQVDIPADLLSVYGDRGRLVQVVQNLLDNAVKFLGDQPQPCIVIGARQHGEETVCYVQDNGVGIDPSYHDKIFGLFERLASHSAGTGVGLALVKRIIEVHGGRVWVESQPGQGATFYFTLPQTDGVAVS